MPSLPIFRASLSILWTASATSPMVQRISLRPIQQRHPLMSGSFTHPRASRKQPARACSEIPDPRPSSHDLDQIVHIAHRVTDQTTTTKFYNRARAHRQARKTRYMPRHASTRSSVTWKTEPQRRPSIQGPHAWAVPVSVKYNAVLRPSPSDWGSDFDFGPPMHPSIMLLVLGHGVVSE